jgi:MoaE-MoaD fusion protein
VGASVSMTDSVRIQVLFFGQLKDATGCAERSLEVEAGATAGAVFDRLAGEHERLGALKASILMAVNQEYATGAVVLKEGDEVAFLPPVSGGSGPWVATIEGEDGHFFALTRERIDSAALAARLTRASDGAVVTFEGVVRNNSGGRATRFLDYEGYEPMALKVIAEIGREMAVWHGIGRIAIVHRLGRLEIGEASVSVVVASPHRAAAFDAVREVMDLLKTRVPIWKKEHFEDGEVWVEGAWDASLPRP